MDTEHLKTFIAEAAGVLAHRAGGVEVDAMLRRIGDRLVGLPPQSGGDSRRAWFEIVDDVCARASISRAAVLSRSMDKAVVAARHACWRRLYDAQDPDGKRRFSSPKIGRWFGRHHTAVLHALGRTSKSKP